MSRLDLAGRAALVTGGGAGIGAATCRLLVARGASVVVVDRDGRAAKEVATGLGHRALAAEADVTDAAAMRHAVDVGLEAFGRLDLVVAGAGITPPPATLRRAWPDDVARVLAVNVMGVLHTVQAASDALVETGGQVVVIGSAAAYSPPVGGAAYMVSKAAVEVLTRGFRIELSPHGVGVTHVAFGFVDTQLARATLDDHEVGRMGDALLPAPLRKRISADEAATVLVDAAQRRAARVTAPRAWAPLGVLRGVLTPPMDAVLTRSARIADVVGLLEREGV